VSLGGRRTNEQMQKFVVLQKRVVLALDNDPTGRVGGLEETAWGVAGADPSPLQEPGPRRRGPPGCRLPVLEWFPAREYNSGNEVSKSPRCTVIPDYQAFMLPLLRTVADDNDHVLRGLARTLADEFSLTDEERQQLLPSGQKTVLADRLSWAKTYL